MAVTLPKWKERRLKAKAELEAAEEKERHDRFWAAVEQSKAEPSRLTSTTTAGGQRVPGMNAAGVSAREFWQEKSPGRGYSARLTHGE